MVETGVLQKCYAEWTFLIFSLPLAPLNLPYQLFTSRQPSYLFFLRIFIFNGSPFDDFMHIRQVRPDMVYQWHLFSSRILPHSRIATDFLIALMRLPHYNGISCHKNSPTLSAGLSVYYLGWTRLAFYCQFGFGSIGRFFTPHSDLNAVGTHQAFFIGIIAVLYHICRSAAPGTPFRSPLYHVFQ